MTTLTPHSIKTSATVTLALAFIFTTMACKNGQSTASASADKSDAFVATTDKEGSDSDYMKAPSVEPGTYGLVALAQCPTEDTHLSVVMADDGESLQILYDGKELQTISDEEGFAAPREESQVHFMDANFDGYTDIFVGPAQSRTYSTLLIFDNATRQFVRIGSLGTPSLQNFMLHPASKTVFEGGSNSWCNNSYTKSQWKDGRLDAVEDLTAVSDPAEYGANGVAHAYTLRSADGKDLTAADSVDKLPEEWRNYLRAQEVE